MSTQVQICNLALTRMGSSKAIASVNPPDQSLAAQLCARLWDMGRRFVLQEGDWNFARRRVTLALTALPQPTNWLYAYQYPAGCVFARDILIPDSPVVQPPYSDQVTWPGQWMNPATPTNAQRIPFQLAGDDAAGRIIYCNIQNAQLSYTEDVTDPTQFPEIFASALAWWLCAELAAPLMNVPQAAQGYRSAFYGELSTALARDLSEGREYPEPDSQFIQARQ